VVTIVGYYRLATNLSQWEASLAHPSGAWKYITGNGSTTEECQTDFIQKYNEDMGTSLENDEFEFIRRPLVTAHIEPSADGLIIRAEANNQQITVLVTELEAAKAEFIQAYNDARGIEFEEIEYQFIQL
jgi:hypothetical protein